VPAGTMNIYIYIYYCKKSHGIVIMSPSSPRSEDLPKGQACTMLLILTNKNTLSFAINIVSLTKMFALFVTFN
jgi:hypothetical protein